MTTIMTTASAATAPLSKMSMPFTGATLPFSMRVWRTRERLRGPNVPVSEGPTA